VVQFSTPWPYLVVLGVFWTVVLRGVVRARRQTRPNRREHHESN
jgi:hypothetical protein